jgi:hypothetical protein
MTNVVAIPNGRSGFSLAPQSLDEAMRFAEILSKSSIVPKDYQGSAGNILVAVQWGAELGLPPLQAMQNIAVINGRPAIWGDAVIAIVRASGQLESITEDIGQDAATCTVKRRGEPEVSRTFSIEDAKRAGLAGKQGPWQQYPKRMLQMRARAWALRDVFPDVLRGVHVAEEAQDIAPEVKDMGPVDQVQPSPAPASRAERARAAIAKKRATPALEHSVGTVLEAIGNSKSLDELLAAADLAKALQDDAQKAQARDAFKARRAELEAAAATRNAEPSPEEPGNGEELAMTYAQVRDALEAAQSVDALDAAADLIGQVASEDHRAELAALYRSLREPMTN